MESARGVPGAARGVPGAAGLALHCPKSRTLVRGGQTSPQRPRLVVSLSLSEARVDLGVVYYCRTYYKAVSVCNMCAHEVALT